MTLRPLARTIRVRRETATSTPEAFEETLHKFLPFLPRGLVKKSILLQRALTAYVWRPRQRSPRDARPFSPKQSQFPWHFRALVPE